MKNLLLAASLGAGLVAFGAAPAFAVTLDTTGNVAVTGNVTAKCVAISGGTGSSFSGTIPLGELADGNGVLASSLSGSTASGAAGSATFRINCNSTNPTVTISASRLSNVTPAPSGYSNDIDYTAQADISKAGGGVTTFAYTTASTLPSATSGQVGDAIANAGSNVVVKVYGLTAEGGGSSLLVAGSYTSTVTVVITPT